ncbi:serpin family protein [Cohnella cholangitidis]|uniref:Serpin family protein n=1 Tax=Cohnella cholangitidis TaxID=2598458 RepID=A0A7G5C5M3_9BACL|nr:serpin family protein [Cohnella cholangitidis]QMV44507.1 serpin family protein [Cohnella cholangitidis]
MRFKVGSALVLAALLSAGCANTENKQEISEQLVPLKSVDMRVVNSANAFGLRMYEQLSKTSPYENRFVSPLSVSTALALAYNGAAEETKEAMGKAMGIDEIELEQLNDGYHELISRLRRSKTGDTELMIANSLWMREGKPFHDYFVQRASDELFAEATVLDFESSDAVRTMNEWVKDTTSGKITEMVKEVDPGTMLYILNAVYFQGAWTVPFEPEFTKKDEFIGPRGQAIPVDMMARGGSFEYTVNPDYEAIRLPYGKYESAVMTIFLPNEDVGLAELQRSIANKPNLVTEPFEVRQGRIELPRVKFEYQIALNDTLKALGMEAAFDRNKADFSLMAPEPPNLFIGNVEHKTYLELNEQGTTAAAATAIEMMEGAAQPDNLFHMKVNRPFMFAITDQDTGCILFIGTIAIPT